MRINRIKCDEDKVYFAELIKNLSSRNLDLRLILCGIGQSVDDILGAHLSSARDRIIEAIAPSTMQPWRSGVRRCRVEAIRHNTADA